MSDIIPIGDRHALLETDMFDLRLTCLIGDPSETDMPHRRPTYLNGAQHAWSVVGVRRVQNGFIYPIIHNRWVQLLNG